MELAKQLIDLLKPYFESITVDHEVPHRVELRASGLRVDAPEPTREPRPWYYVLGNMPSGARDSSIGFSTKKEAEDYMARENVKYPLKKFAVIKGINTHLEIVNVSTTKIKD